jgi:RimJ/RimL family protein N-acetyltransferase
MHPAPAPAITFRPLRPDDLPLLCEWVNRPHVAQWWDEPRTQAAIDDQYLPVATGASTTHAFIACVDGQAIGFIQSDVVMGSGDGWWADETDPGARGIDQFLADGSRLSRGLGTAMVRSFTDRLLSDPAVTKVQTDPSPANARAIRCYAKAGFRAVGHVDTPDGPALLMVARRKHWIPACAG